MVVRLFAYCVKIISMYQPQDSFFHKAKQEGYPARSVYKLQELDKKHKLLQPGQFILDLGCAPGSWSLYAAEKVKPGGKVVGVDLQATDLDVENFFFLQGDVSQGIRPSLVEIMAREDIPAFDGLISDMAPATSGIKSLDAGRSAELVEGAFELGQNFLKEGGFLILKILEGGEHDRVWRQVKSAFARQKQVRPKAVRRNSREIYIVADGFKRD